MTAPSGKTMTTTPGDRTVRTGRPPSTNKKVLRAIALTPGMDARLRAFIGDGQEHALSVSRMAEHGLEAMLPFVDDGVESVFISRNGEAFTMTIVRAE